MPHTEPMLFAAFVALGIAVLMTATTSTMAAVFLAGFVAGLATPRHRE